MPRHVPPAIEPEQEEENRHDERERSGEVDPRKLGAEITRSGMREGEEDADVKDREDGEGDLEEEGPAPADIVREEATEWGPGCLACRPRNIRDA